MLDNDVMIASGDRYLQHPMMNILLSLVITPSVMANVFILNYMRDMSPWFYLLIYFCFFASVLFAAHEISFAMKTRPAKRRKIIIAAIIWAAVLSAVGAAFRQTLQSGINKWICYISFGVFAWLLGGILVLSICHMITGSGLFPGRLLLNHKKMCVTVALAMSVLTCAVICCALGFAIPQSRFNSFATYEGIKRAERRWLCLFMLGFIPFYILTFTSLYEYMISKQE